MLNDFVNRLHPKYVKSVVRIPLTEEEVANHPNHDDRIFWLQQQRDRIEYEAKEANKREAAGDKDQSGLSRPHTDGTGTSS